MPSEWSSSYRTSPLPEPPRSPSSVVPSPILPLAFGSTHFRLPSRRAASSVGELLLGEFTVEWGLAAGRSLLDGDKLPDGIVCGNDLIAAGVLRQLTLAGVRVPDDVLVTGFDDVPAAALVTPSLTTVRQPLEAIVREALRLLSEGLDRSRRPFQRVAISPELVVRASTSCNEAPNGERG